MRSVINKIFNGESGEDVHNEFVKYSRGVFEGKYLIEAKRQKDKWSIKTGPEFANFFVMKCLGDAEGKIKVKGVVVSTQDLRDGLGIEVEDVKQFMGIKQFVIDSEVNPDELIASMNNFPKAFFALSFSTNKNELKIKAKAPKSAKPAAGGEKEVKAEFCSLKTSDGEIARDLFFDFQDFKEARIVHTIDIKDIEIPSGEKDPVKMRELAIRKGRIIRKIEIDGVKHEREMGFEA